MQELKELIAHDQNWPDIFNVIAKDEQLATALYDRLFETCGDYRDMYRNNESYQLSIAILQLLKSKFVKDIAIKSFWNLSISSFYADSKNIGKISNELLMHDPSSSGLLGSIRSNSMFYVEPLKYDMIIDIDPKLPKLKYPYDSYQNYDKMNPVIQPCLSDPGNWWCIIRTVNYGQQFARDFTSHDRDGKIRTTNLLLKLDNTFEILNQWTIVDNLPRIHYPTHVLDMEDCRLINRINPETEKEELYFSCCCFDTHSFGVPKICWAKIAQSPNEFMQSDCTELEIDRLITVFGPHKTQIEKNWLPYIENNNFYYIYKPIPLQVYQFDPDEPNRDFKLISEIESAASNNGNNHIRNSAGPIRFKNTEGINGYLFITHEVVSPGENKRHYYHRFVWYESIFDNKSDILITDMFYFKDKGIEFTPGITANEEDEDIYIGLGREDKECYIVTISNIKINNMLHKIDKIDDLFEKYLNISENQENK